MSFIPVQNLISYRVYMEFILPEWYEVSFEPLFEHKPFWSVVNYRLAFTTRPSQLSHSSRTGTKPCTCFTWYRYRMWSDFIPVREPEWARLVWLVPVQHFVLVSCKRIYRATSGHQDELVPEWNLYRYHVNTPLRINWHQLLLFVLDDNGPVEFYL